MQKENSVYPFFFSEVEFKDFEPQHMRRGSTWLVQLEFKPVIGGSATRFKFIKFGLWGTLSAMNIKNLLSNKLFASKITKRILIQKIYKHLLRISFRLEMR